MTSIAALVDRARRSPGCEVLDAVGRPVVEPGDRLGDELLEFYACCGGLRFPEWSLALEIVPPARFVRANDVILEAPAHRARHVTCAEPSRRAASRPTSTP